MRPETWEEWYDRYIKKKMKRTKKCGKFTIIYR